MSKLVPFLLLIAVAAVVRGDDVCSICACESGKTFPVLIDCQKMKLQTLFREWSLPESFVARNDIMFDVDLAENDVEVVDVIQRLPVQKISFKKNKIRSITPGWKVTTFKRKQTSSTSSCSANLNTSCTAITH